MEKKYIFGGVRQKIKICTGGPQKKNMWGGSPPKNMQGGSQGKNMWGGVEEKNKICTGVSAK